MSQFTDPLVVELVGKNLWKVYLEFDYHIGEYPSKDIIKVPCGFVTNFASVPRIFWPIISPIDKHGKAAVVHDYLYYSGMFPKKKADLIFKEALGVLNVKPWKVSSMYRAVSLFGWGAWLRCRRKNK